MSKIARSLCRCDRDDCRKSFREPEAIADASIIGHIIADELRLFSEDLRQNAILRDRV
jgi:hypothetical protein